MSKPEIQRIEFPSVSAYGRYITELMSQKPQEGADNASSSDRGYHWTLGVDLKTAATMASNGGDWHDGAADLLSVSIEDMAATVAESIDLALIHDVTGGFLDVPEYLNGESPEIFMRMEEEPHQARPIIRIGANVGCSAGTEGSYMVNRGRALLALVDALEMQGYSVELNALHVSQEVINGKQLAHIKSVAVKQAGAEWSAPAAAFALAHPAFPRRLGFKALEHAPGHSVLTDYGYGNGRLDLSGDYDIFIPYQQGNSGIRTAKEALDSLMDHVKTQKPELGL